MTKEAIATMMGAQYAEFIYFIEQLSEEELLKAPEGKWNALQQLDHLVRSTAPVNMAMGLPKLVLSWRFGKSNRPSKTYEELVQKYITKLQAGGRASGRFVPGPAIGIERKAALIQQMQTIIRQLQHRIHHQKETALDTYILPHPLLGKLTLREMLYFTAYHVLHHLTLVKKGLA